MGVGVARDARQAGGGARPDRALRPLHDLIRKLSAENFLSEAALDTLAWTTTIDEALDQIEARLGELPAVPAVIEQVESAP